MSAAMLTVGFATSMTQAAQAAQVAQASQAASVLTNPTVASAKATTAFNTPVSLKPTTASTGTDLRFCLVAPELSTSAASEANCSTGPVQVSGEGVWNIAAKTGEVLFTPASDFAGTTTSVDYLATDSVGSSKAPLTVDVQKPSAPSVSSMVSTAPYNTAVTVKPSASGNNIASRCLIDSAHNDACVQALTVAGEGSYDLAADGSVKFTPENGFTGKATAVKYQVTDAFGQHGVGTISITVTSPAAPVVTPVDAKSAFGKTFSFKPRVTGVGANFAKTCLIAPNGQACTDSFVVAGEGTWKITNQGWASFTPEANFTGATTPVTYQIANDTGSVGSATAVITVQAPAAPSVRASFEITDYNTAVVVTPEVTGDAID
jgi:CshA-type fibril repeat protein